MALFCCNFVCCYLKHHEGVYCLHRYFVTEREMLNADIDEHRNHSRGTSDGQ